MTTNERRSPLPAIQPARVRRSLWPAAILGALVLMLAVPAVGRSDESNPNNYNCLGTLGAGQPEPGSEEQQVKYFFYCNGPITGYQLAALAVAALGVACFARRARVVPLSGKTGERNGQS